jgi:hypothetical protein
MGCVVTSILNPLRRAGEEMNSTRPLVFFVPFCVILLMCAEGVSEAAENVLRGRGGLVSFPSLSV